MTASRSHTRPAGRRARIAVLAGAALAIGLLLAAAAAGEVAQKGRLRVSFEGAISPQRLPRHGLAPIAVGVAGRVATTDRSDPPALRRLEIAINRNGRLDTRGLPTCSLSDIQPASTENALRACRDALVGEGSFSASVADPERSPFPPHGKLLAFNGVEAGRQVIFAHVYGTDPVPTSFTLPMRIGRAKGTFSTVLGISLPAVDPEIAFITGISLDLHRAYRFRGRTHSYLSAGCPAPQGFPGAVFPLLRASFVFAAGRRLDTTLRRSCKAKD